MKFKPAHLREKASHDVDQIIEYYPTEANEDTALGFVDALEKGFAHIGRHPSPDRHFTLTNLIGPA